VHSQGDCSSHRVHFSAEARDRLLLRGPQPAAHCCAAVRPNKRIQQRSSSARGNPLTIYIDELARANILAAYAHTYTERAQRRRGALLFIAGILRRGLRHVIRSGISGCGCCGGWPGERCRSAAAAAAVDDATL